MGRCDSCWPLPLDDVRQTFTLIVRPGVISNFFVRLCILPGVLGEEAFRLCAGGLWRIQQALPAGERIARGTQGWSRYPCAGDACMRPGAME